YDGQAWWDRAGKAAGGTGSLATANVSMASAFQSATTSIDPSAPRRYSLYTPELNLMSETEVATATTPAVAYDYIWFAGQPVAQVEVSTNTTHWTFTDHLGTPILQTDAGGTVDWRAEYEPYGTIWSLRAGNTRHQPLRFPGQEAEQLDSTGGAVTERAYNIFRWYRGGWGRYTQPDPLVPNYDGSLYAYANGTPLTAVDPLGLYKINQRGIHQIPLTNIRAACPGLGSACTL